MKKTGFIGLGIMGRPMAENLLKAGCELYVYDVSPAAVERLTALGAKASDPAGIGRNCDVIFLSLPNGSISQSVLFDEGGAYGAFIMFDTPDPTYAVIYDGQWKYDGPYRTIHRVASDHTRGGVFREIMEYASRDAEHIRMDTYRDNTVMQHVLEKAGFERRGTIHLLNGSPRIAYEWEKRADA